MAKVVKIYCEGKAGSHDFDVLSKVVDGLSVLIKPIGSKKGAKSAIQVYESGLNKSDFKLLFRDRDFDAPVPNSEKLHFDGSYVYYSYRTTIENYLLDYDLIENYSVDKPWVHKLKESYYSTAKSIRFFQAVRRTLGELRIPTDFGSNIEDNSGKLPKDLSADYCREKGYEIVLKKTSKTSELWGKDNFDKTFNKYVELFSDEFIENDKFLIYFQGKDFAKAFCREIPSFNIRRFYQYAKEKIDYNQFGDLKQLRTLLAEQV